MKTIALEDVPGRKHGYIKYPYEEWLKIPVGRAVDISSDWPELTDGRTSRIVAQSIRNTLRATYPSLLVMARGDVVYIARVAE